MSHAQIFGFEIEHGETQGEIWSIEIILISDPDAIVEERLRRRCVE